MTALQELIVFSEKLDNNVNIKNKYATLLGVARSFLEKEKQQIAHAYEMGFIEEMKETFKTGKEFYESVYE